MVCIQYVPVYVQLHVQVQTCCVVHTVHVQHMQLYLYMAYWHSKEGSTCKLHHIMCL